MGLRLRKSIRILPGLKLNISKTGTSVTLGGRGISYNISKKGNRTTLGIPGSGISYSTYQAHEKETNEKARKTPAWIWLLVVLSVIVIAALVNVA